MIYLSELVLADLNATSPEACRVLLNACMAASQVQWLSQAEPLLRAMLPESEWFVYRGGHHIAIQRYLGDGSKDTYQVALLADSRDAAHESALPDEVLRAKCVSKRRVVTVDVEQFRKFMESSVKRLKCFDTLDQRIMRFQPTEVWFYGEPMTGWLPALIDAGIKIVVVTRNIHIADAPRGAIALNPLYEGALCVCASNRQEKVWEKYGQVGVPAWYSAPSIVNGEWAH